MGSKNIKVLRAHEGNIAVGSIGGQGTTFLVTWFSQ
jgi:hypothetical protein